MKASTRYGSSLFAVSLVAVACGPSSPSAEDLNNKNPMSASGGSGGASSAGNTSGGSTTAGSSTAGGTGVLPLGGSGGTESGGGAGPAAGTGGGGGSGGSAEPAGPYSPRTGSFKMLIYSRTKGYRHDGSIASGKPMLAQIAQEQGFEVAYCETDQENDMYITPEGLAPFELIFFLNSTGAIFTDVQKQTYEDWMTTKNGAFAGTHSATDTENGWAFYSEVTGQYYNGHGAAGTADQIKFEEAMLNHPSLKGLPNPWQRNEEWYKFDQWQAWSAKPGFQILGKKNADSQPIMWLREWSNFRAFYTAIGHDAVVFQDPDVKKHITGGIMWAVRRDHLIK